jgi:hypothetical protein
VAALIAGIVGGFLPGIASGQGCCSPSTTPVSALHGGPTGAKSFEAGVFYEYFELRGNLEGRSKVSDPQDRVTRMHAANVLVAFAPWDRFGLRAVIPFARREREQALSTSTVQRRDELVGAGLGDIALLAQARVLPLHGIHPYSLSLGAGVKLATGAFQQSENGVRLPLDLQPGTGCEDFLATVYGDYFGRPSWNVFAGSVWRLTGTNKDGYGFGDELQVFGGVAYELVQRWSVLLESRYRHAEPDQRNGAAVPSTGNDRIFLAPGLSYAPGGGRTTLTAALLWPAYERANGTQLATRVGSVVSLQHRFALSASTP